MKKNLDIYESKVLDKGFIKLIDVMGSDADICMAARKSYGKGTRSVSEDRDLIRYMMRNQHSGVFEMAELKFFVKCPIYVWRQWIRTRTASVNELSLRYSLSERDFHVTSPVDQRSQSTINKQGSEGYLPLREAQYLTFEEEQFFETAGELYQKRVETGLSRELARKVLPLSTYTEAYWKIDLRNLLHFLHLRLDTHAQDEIRQYAEIMALYVGELFPLVWEAFQDYTLSAITLSATDIRTIRDLESIRNNPPQYCENIISENFPNKREREEFITKHNILFPSGRKDI